jgi:hypothetical protein
VLDQEANHALVRAERCAMDAQRRFILAFLLFVNFRSKRGGTAKST